MPMPKCYAPFVGKCTHWPFTVVGVQKINMQVTRTTSGPACGSQHAINTRIAIDFYVKTERTHINPIYTKMYTLPSRALRPLSSDICRKGRSSTRMKNMWVLS